MSSSSSVNTLQRLVEQLKLEAGVERIRPIIVINSSGAKQTKTQVYASLLHAHKHLSVREASPSLFQVSQAAAELQQYCMQNACKDALLVGVPAGSNPFREPRSCALL